MQCSDEQCIVSVDEWSEQGTLNTGGQVPEVDTSRSSAVPNVSLLSPLSSSTSSIFHIFHIEAQHHHCYNIVDHSISSE